MTYNTTIRANLALHGIEALRSLEGKLRPRLEIGDWNKPCPPFGYGSLLGGRNVHLFSMLTVGSRRPEDETLTDPSGILL